MSDSVNRPSHYNAGSVETIEGIKAALGDAFLDYCRGNVLKYVWRCRHKGKLLEDLRKAAKYLEWAIAEAESEKLSEPQELEIPEGWRELEENEPLCKDDLFELDGEWVGHEYDPSGGVYSSRIHCRHIRKIETHEPEPLAIPEGWRELEFGETRLKTDLYNHGGKWNFYIDFDPAESEFPRYDKRIHQQHIRKIETEKPEHVDGVWVEEADANAKKIKPAEWIPKVGDKVRVIKPGKVVNGLECVIVEAVNGNYTVDRLGLISKNFKAEHLQLIKAAQ